MGLEVERTASLHLVGHESVLCRTNHKYIYTLARRQTHRSHTDDILTVVCVCELGPVGVLAGGFSQADSAHTHKNISATFQSKDGKVMRVVQSHTF